MQRAVKNTAEKKKSKSREKMIRRGIGAAVLLLVVLWLVYGNVSLQTTIYDVVLPSEYAGLDGFSIVQISDLHNARFGKEQARLLEAVEEQAPDIIVVTGDLVDSNHTDPDVAMDFMQKAVEIAPVYYVTGNHEGWIGSTYDELKKRMADAGVCILDNKCIAFKQGNTTISILGVEDPDMPGNNVVLTQKSVLTLSEETDGYKILLSHRPELFDTYVESNVDLAFAGHYHGGQFRIPFIGGVIAPGAGLFPKYAEGTFTEDNTTMVVSRGLGNSVIPVRINNRPEVVVVRLQAYVE